MIFLLTGYENSNKIEYEEEGGYKAFYNKYPIF